MNATLAKAFSLASENACTWIVSKSSTRPGMSTLSNESSSMRGRFGSQAFHLFSSSGVSTSVHSVPLRQSSWIINLGSSRIDTAYPNGSKTFAVCDRHLVLVHSMSFLGW